MKIVDFGIAVAAGGGLIGDARQSGPAAAVGGEADVPAELAERFTMPGTILGTPHYMSPEQADELPIDARSDQYALGCILYELLTGTVPFDHPTNPTAILIGHARTPVEPPRKRCPAAEISEGVEAVVLRMLAKRREERFPSMTEVAAALQRELLTLAPDEPIAGAAAAVPGPGAQGRLSTQVVLRPRRWQLLIFVSAAALLVAGSGYLGYRQWQLGRREVRRPVSAQLVAELRQRSTALLGSGLSAPQREVRLGALQALGRSQDVEARKLIEPLLASPAVSADPTLLAQAAEALGQLGDRAALPALAAALDRGPGPSARAAIADAMDLLDDERGQRVLVEMLDGSDEEARFRAAYLLCRKGYRKAVAVLAGLLERSHPPEDVLLDSLARLAQAGEESARQQLAQRLVGAGPRAQKLPIAFRLAQLGDERGLAVLRDLAGHPGPEQLLAARLLAAIEHPDVAPLFRRVLADPQASPASQAAATEGLGLAGDLPDLLVLGPRLDGRSATAKGPPPGEPLRQLAAASVLQIVASDPSVMSEQGLRWARGAATDGSWIVRESAAAVLGDLPDGGATQLLGQMLKDGDARVRRGAVRSLGKRPSRPALLALREALYDREGAVRSEALKSILRVGKALQQQGDKGLLAEVGGWFKDVLASGPQTEQLLARSVLRKLGDASQDAALQGLQKTPDRELRRLLLEQADAGTIDTGLLVATLTDADAGLRQLAARRLAERGDGRAAPVLRESLGQGGPGAIVAYGLLRRLGQTAELPPDIAQGLSSPNVEQRLATVESFGKLPPDLAVSLLAEAARDPERLVRRLVAEVAADLPEQPGGPAGLPVLRFLQRDVDPGVRFRVQALLARFGDLRRFALASQPLPAAVAAVRKRPPAEAATPPATAPVETSPPAPTETPPPVAAGSGQILVRPVGAQFQLDRRPWQVATDKPIDVPVGAHRLVSLGGEQKLDVAMGSPLSVELTESPIERSAHSGLSAFERRDYSKALRLLAKAAADCEKKRKLAQPCAALSAELKVRIGEIYEKQDQIVEAAGEYQGALQIDPERRARPELRQQAEQGLARLGRQLGRITLPKTDRNGKCREVTQWVLPGSQIVSKDGQSQMVRVRAGEINNLGACP